MILDMSLLILDSENSEHPPVKVNNPTLFGSKFIRLDHSVVAKFFSRYLKTVKLKKVSRFTQDLSILAPETFSFDLLPISLLFDFVSLNFTF